MVMSRINKTHIRALRQQSAEAAHGQRKIP
jgi:hypothetical protein